MGLAAIVFDTRKITTTAGFGEKREPPIPEGMYNFCFCLCKSRRAVILPYHIHLILLPKKTKCKMIMLSF